MERTVMLLDWGGTLMEDFGRPGPMRYWPVVEAVPGAREALAALAANWRLALATNAADSGPEDIRAALERVDLLRFLNAVHCYKSVGEKKPASAFYHSCALNMGVAPSDCVMVGDDLEVDARGAARAGMFGVWLNRNSAERVEEAGVATMRSLAELPMLAQRLRRCAG